MSKIIQNELPNLNFAQRSKEISSRWKKLSENDKKEYNELALKEKELKLQEEIKLGLKQPKKKKKKKKKKVRSILTFFLKKKKK